MKKELDFVYKGSHPIGLLNQLDEMGVEYYVKESQGSMSIIYDDTEFFYSFDEHLRKGAYLIGMVKRDFYKFIENKKDFKLNLENYNSNFVNMRFDKNKKTIKFDINHAYWRIAYNDGIISKPTYENGLKIKSKGSEFKKVYCIALSVQGSQRSFVKYKKGRSKKESIVVDEENKKMKNLYLHIRNKTYSLMDDLAYKLGDSFKEYNVDCVEIEDTVNNRKLVSDYLTQNNLTFKIITK